ncbi:hypothetical protein [Roseicella frigidaeris]|uniref:hypothetical protein n=1 Tax=Roseicella frigidaeris TaxID=2230885 RepID=UPI000DAEDBB3|nr:hypothetical protein [Roseicella frigidaeris]
MRHAFGAAASGDHAPWIPGWGAPGWGAAAAVGPCPRRPPAAPSSVWRLARESRAFEEWLTAPPPGEPAPRGRAATPPRRIGGAGLALLVLLLALGGWLAWS